MYRFRNARYYLAIAVACSRDIMTSLYSSSAVFKQCMSKMYEGSTGFYKSKWWNLWKLLHHNTLMWKLNSRTTLIYAIPHRYKLQPSSICYTCHILIATIYDTYHNSTGANFSFLAEPQYLQIFTPRNISWSNVIQFRP